jgi:hypothetical protein
VTKLDYKDVAYYGKPIASLNKEELLEVVLELAKIINDCPVKGGCKKLFEFTDMKAGEN